MQFNYNQRFKMKKLYTLLLIVVSTLSFGQILSEDFNYADGALLTENGWTAFSGKVLML